jgi:hypothetical protein
MKVPLNNFETSLVRLGRLFTKDVFQHLYGEVWPPHLTSFFVRLLFSFTDYKYFDPLYKNILCEQSLTQSTVSKRVTLNDRWCDLKTPSSIKVALVDSTNTLLIRLESTKMYLGVSYKKNQLVQTLNVPRTSFFIWSEKSEI